MADTMAGLRLWLRPPRNLMIVFLLVMLLPTATLVFLSVRLIEQDRVLVNPTSDRISGAYRRLCRKPAPTGIRDLDERSQWNGLCINNGL
jgi:hypothetical protein